MKELHEKLAKWAGFAQSTSGHDIVWLLDNKWPPLEELPNFTESLDACFRWLVPKLPPLLYLAFWPVHFNGQEFWDVPLQGYGASFSYTERAETPALALCQAIEQLIDAEPLAPV